MPDVQNFPPSVGFTFNTAKLLFRLKWSQQKFTEFDFTVLFFFPSISSAISNVINKRASPPKHNTASILRLSFLGGNKPTGQGVRVGAGLHAAQLWNSVCHPRQVRRTSCHCAGGKVAKVYIKSRTEAGTASASSMRIMLLSLAISRLHPISQNCWTIYKCLREPLCY